MNDLDPRWPSGASLFSASIDPQKSNVGLLGLSTYLTSVTPRSTSSTPLAVREALRRYSTWSYDDQVDLGELAQLIDLGDVVDPDGRNAPERVQAAFAHDMNLDMTVVLGGDNAATWRAMSALAGAELGSWGLVTFDAHHDLRDGISNGSPVRQLLEQGLRPNCVVQLGLADFSNSPEYARRAREAGITVVSRGQMRSGGVLDAVATALDIAGAQGRSVYVDVDLDVCDRSVVPGCPAAAPGGLSADELRLGVRTICADARVRAIDFTEVDVERDSDDERTVRLAALLVIEALAGVLRRTR